MPSESSEGENPHDRDEEMVWTAARQKVCSVLLHTDPDCPRVNDSMFEKKRSLYPEDSDICEVCRGATPPKNEGMVTKETRWKLESMNPEDLGLSPAGERRGQP